VTRTPPHGTLPQAPASSTGADAGVDAAGVRVQLGDWPSLRAQASAVRFAVFVKEQGVPAEIELDEHDAAAVHALALDPRGEVLGTGRLLPDGRIGRMAVLVSARGRGVGAHILRALVDAARARGDGRIELHAQIRAVGFYRRHGFTAVGEPYEEAGIAHQTMVRRL
jgi:predicted GNAT family N-acyltransferase